MNRFFRLSLMLALCLPAGTVSHAGPAAGRDTIPDSGRNEDIQWEDVLSGITVTASRDRLTYHPGRMNISASEALTSDGGTAMDVLSGIPSVTIDADGELSLRGSQGYLVYVDGKPSPLEGSDALRQIPASIIEDIEIITTPGAAYRTDGDVGIINIITRKPLSDSWSGTFSATAGTQGSWGADGTLNFKKGDHLVYAGGTFQDIITRSDFLQDKRTLVDDYLTVSNSDGYRYRTFGTYVGRGGWHWDNGTHSITAELQAGRTRNTRGGYMLYTEERSFGGGPADENVFDAHDDYILFKKLLQESLSYVWKADSATTLRASSRLRYDRHSLEYTESNLHTPGGVRTEGTRGYEQEHHWDADADIAFSHRFPGTLTMEAGYQYVTYSEHGGYSFKAWDASAQDFLQDPSLDIPFYYRRQVHSLYATATASPGRWRLDAGLRGDEVIDRMDISMSGASRFSRRFEPYPSAHASYRLSGDGSIFAGYSRRTSRPGIWKLEPYITYEDYYTRIVGNPDLLPEYIHSAEAGWKKGFAGGRNLSVAGFYRARSGVVDVIRLPYEPGITLDKIVNAGDRDEYGMELSGTFNPFSWWAGSANGSIYRYDFDALIPECSDAEAFSWTANMTNVFTMSPGLRLQFDAHMVGPCALSQGREEAYCFFDLAARQQALGGRLSISVVAHNVFGTARYENFRFSPGLESHTIVRPQYPNITFGLSYSFNSKVREKTGSISSEASFDGKDF